MSFFNTFGKIFRFTTWGRSHGPAIGCIIDGCPPNIPLSEKDIQKTWIGDAQDNQSLLLKGKNHKVSILSGYLMENQLEHRFLF